MGSSIDANPKNDFGPNGNWYNDPAGALAGMLGFGPGLSWTPAQEAAREAEIRQARSKSAENRINDIFNSDARDSAYNKVQTATTQHFLQQLNKQRDQAQRRLKFGLASRGLTGGSQAVFDQGLAAQDYLTGKVNAVNRGLNSAQQMRINDEQARERLLSLAQSGLQSGSSAAMAQRALAQNLANAQQRSQIGALGDVFGDLLGQYNNYKQYQEQEALRNRYYKTLYDLGFQSGGY